MALLETDKSDIRRHLRYDAIGLYSLSPGGASLALGSDSYRYFRAYGQLEYKMLRLKPDEEARVTGKAYGAIGFNNPGGTLPAGQTFTVTLASAAFTVSPITVSYTTVTGDTYLSVCVNVANLFAANQYFSAAGFYSNAPYGTGTFSNTIVPLPICAFVAPVGQTFTMTVSATGSVIPQIVGIPGLLPPFMSLDNTLPATTIYGYVPILNQIEALSSGSITNMDTIKAGNWSWNTNEFRDKNRLMNHWRGELAKFLGVPINPDNRAMTGGNGGMRRMY